MRNNNDNNEEFEFLESGYLEEDNDTWMEEPKREKDYNLFIIGLLSGVLLVLLFMGILLMRIRADLEKRAAARADQQEEELDLDMIGMVKKMQEIEAYINYYSIYPVKEEYAEEKIMDGLLESLDDPYSVYYTKKEKEDMEESYYGEYSGIGAVLSQDRETNVVTVTNCFTGSPAEEVGLKKGDIIKAVNDIDVTEMELALIVAKIRTEEGASIKLTVLREDETIDFDIVRRKIEVQTVESEMLEDHIGYIILSEFDIVTENQFYKALDDLSSQGMERLIIDLRDNPGGVLQVVVKMLDRILPEGLIVYTEDKHGNRSEYTSDEENKLTIPLVVLINENSASASEIFSGAVKDYGIGTLVGKTTFGKGIVQNSFDLEDGTGIKLTVAKYYTPNGNDIHLKGVEPDVEIDLDFGDATEYSKEVDNQLQKAIEVIKSIQ